MGNTTGKNKEVLVLEGKITKEANNKVTRSNKKFATEKSLKNLKDLYMINYNSDILIKQDKNNIDDLYTNFNNLKIETKRNYDNVGNYTFLKTIGKGNFGKVLFVKSKVDGNFYALKVLKKINVIKSNIIERIKTEKRVLEKIEHPFIVKLHSSFQSPDKIFFLMDLCNGGEIFFHLHKKKRFSEECVKFYSVQLYLALSFLHSKGIIYRDLKPENIMLDINGIIKLIDMGMVKDKFQEHSKINTVCGTSEYLRKDNLLYVIFSSGSPQRANLWL
jgi:hypothetical protein